MSTICIKFLPRRKKRSHFGRIWNYARTKVQGMLREFGTFFLIVHPLLFWCTFARVCRYERIFVLRMHVIRLGADSTCHNQKEIEVVGDNYRLTNKNNNKKYWNHAEKMGKRKFLGYPRDIVITIQKYSDIFGDQHRDAFSRVVFN